MSVSYSEDVYNGRDRGSYRFSDEQRASGRLIVDVEILTYVGATYPNNKYTYPRNFYGYAQLFHGTEVFREFRLSYGTQRLIDTRNYFAFSYAIVREATLSIVNSFGTIPGEDKTIPDLVSIPALPETVLKVNLEFEGAFSIKVSWWPIPLLNEEGEQIPQDTSDPSDGEDEYQEPQETSPSNPYNGAPDKDQLDPNSDIRDELLGNVGRVVNFSVSHQYYNSSCQLQDEVFNHQWVGAGPPPYSLEVGINPYGFTACPGAQGGGATNRGYRLVASDGSKSQDIRAGVATVSASLAGFNVFE